MLDLRTCKLAKGKLANGDAFIEVIEERSNESQFSIRFDDSAEFTRWGNVLVESIKSDKYMRQIQILDPLKKQEEAKRQTDEIAEVQSRRS